MRLFLSLHCILWGILLLPQNVLSNDGIESSLQPTCEWYYYSYYDTTKTGELSNWPSIRYVFRLKLTDSWKHITEADLNNEISFALSRACPTLRVATVPRGGVVSNRAFIFMVWTGESEMTAKEQIGRHGLQEAMVDCVRLQLQGFACMRNVRPPAFCVSCPPDNAGSNWMLTSRSLK